MKTIKVRPDGEGGFALLRGDAIIGYANFVGNGWRVVPNQAGRRASRKLHPTMTKAIRSMYGSFNMLADWSALTTEQRLEPCARCNKSRSGHDADGRCPNGLNEMFLSGAR